MNAFFGGRCIVMNSIYVSSTYADLRDYRLAVIGTLRRMHHQVVCMEDYGAADQRPLHKCLRDVEVCDLYVGLFAWRYGFVPTHDNPHGRSITELEYRHARALGKACLIFLLDNQQPWPPDFMDSGPDRERLLALRAELSNRYLVGFFRSESDLATHVATAVHNGIADLERQDKDDPPQDDTQPPPIVLPAAVGLRRAFRGHTEPIEFVAVSADGRKAASGSWDKSIRVWDLEVGRMIVQLDGHTGTVSHPGIVHKVLFKASDFQIVSCGYDGTIRIWDVASGRQIRQLAGHAGGVTALALSGNEELLVSGGADRMVRTWDLLGYRQMRQLTGHRGTIRSVAISADGRTAVSGGNDSQLRLWDLTGGKEIQRFNSRVNILRGVDLAPDGSLALSADIDGNICLWDVETGREVRRFVGHTKSVRCAVLFEDLSRMLSASDDDTMRLWDSSSGEEIERYGEHKCAVTAVAVSNDGTTAVSGAVDNTVRLWRLSPHRRTN